MAGRSLGTRAAGLGHRPDGSPAALCYARRPPCGANPDTPMFGEPSSRRTGPSSTLTAMNTRRRLLNWFTRGRVVRGMTYRGEHVYLSTACLHGDHHYCQSNTGVNGSKEPACCKFCGAPCLCSCHEPGGDNMTEPTDDYEDEIDRLANLLTRTANALKGDPGPLRMHDWSDLPDVAARLRQAVER